MLTDRPAVTARVLGPIARDLAAAPGTPRVSAAVAELLRPLPILDETGRRRDGFLSMERALTVRVDGHELVTLMTLGAWPEMLVLGYLFNQDLIASAGALESITVDWDSGIAEVITRAGSCRYRRARCRTRGDQRLRSGKCAVRAGDCPELACTNIERRQHSAAP